MQTVGAVGREVRVCTWRATPSEANRNGGALASLRVDPERGEPSPDNTNGEALAGPQQWPACREHKQFRGSSIADGRRWRSAP